MLTCDSKRATIVRLQTKNGAGEIVTEHDSKHAKIVQEPSQMVGSVLTSDPHPTDDNPSVSEGRQPAGRQPA